MLGAILVGLLFGSQPIVDTPNPALLKVQRVYVDPLTGGEDAARIRDLLITAIQNSKLFVITENSERADTFLRGAASEAAYQEKFSSNERVDARSSRSSSGSKKSSISSPVNLSLGEDESIHLEERKHEAMASVRLVSKDGDVIWSTTKESTGAKFRGAAADVADKVARQLLTDYEKLKKPAPFTP